MYSSPARTGYDARYPGIVTIEYPLHLLYGRQFDVVRRFRRVGLITFEILLDETLTNSIVANSLSGSDLNGAFTGSFNLIEDGSGTGLTGTISGDPLLGPLAYNGGPTLTHGLFYGSPALDGGDPTAVAGVGSVPLYDQRGVGFDRVVDVGAGALIDIGAYEAQTAPLEADLNLDGFVDALDFGILASNFGPTSGGYADGNLNGDAYVDAADIGIMFGVWTGDTGPTAAISISSTDTVQASSTTNSLAGIRQLPISNAAGSKRATVAAVDEQHHQATLLLINAEQQFGGRRLHNVDLGIKASTGKIANQQAEQSDYSVVDEVLQSLTDEGEWFEFL